MPGEYVSSGIPGMAPQIGQTVSLRVRQEANGVQPGFYFVYSETPTDRWDEFSLLRFYFSINPEGAPPLLEYLTTRLNRY
jgi:HopA1 effector protein family